MNDVNLNVDCCLVKDLIPLYLDDLLSDESKEIIENHLDRCDKCSKYMKSMSENSNIEDNFKVDIDDNELDKSGEKLVIEIKKYQDRIKYTFVIFAMVVAVSNTWLSKGLMSTIALVIIIPFMLNLFFKETKVILITAICTNIILALATENIELGIISTPLLLVAVISGTWFGCAVKAIKEGK